MPWSLVDGRWRGARILLVQGIGNNSEPVGYYIPIAQSDVANGVRIADPHAERSSRVTSRSCVPL